MTNNIMEFQQIPFAEKEGYSQQDPHAVPMLQRFDGI
jgi:hypothetical protein